MSSFEMNVDLKTYRKNPIETMFVEYSIFQVYLQISLPRSLVEKNAYKWYDNMILKC